jgi:hypothetical protein
MRLSFEILLLSVWVFSIFQNGLLQDVNFDIVELWRELFRVAHSDFSENGLRSLSS